MNRPGTESGNWTWRLRRGRAHPGARGAPRRADADVRENGPRMIPPFELVRVPTCPRHRRGPPGTRTRSSTSCATRSFFDSNGDGIGDFRGLTSKLDYLQDLGVTALWLLPFYPSPARDDGYDISDYTDVHPDVGTLADFEQLLARSAPPRASASSPSWSSTTRPTSTRGSSARAERRAGIARARLLRVERLRRSATRTPASSSRTSSRRTGRGTAMAERVLLAPLLRAPARSQLREPRGPGGAARGRRLLARPRASTACGSTPSRTSTRRRARTARTCPQTHAFLKKLRAHIDAKLPEPHAPRRGQPVAGGRRRLLRRRATSAT